MQPEKSIMLIGSVGAGGGWYVSPHGYNLYRVGRGDSFESLAGDYLGSADRWSEIYGLQSAGWRAQRRNDPHNLTTGDQLFMPSEAIQAARALGLVAGGGAGQPPGLGGSGDGTRAVQTGPGAYTLPEVTVFGSPAVTVLPKPAPPGKMQTPTVGTAPDGGNAGLLLGGVLAVGAGVVYAIHRRKIHAHVRSVHAFAVHHVKRVHGKLKAADRAIRANPSPSRRRGGWTEV
jgi:hypothetical protein